MEETKERERKQTYLRQQIVQQNYDPGEFVDYLKVLNLTPDIDLLSLNEVKEAVESFKTKKMGDTKHSKVNKGKDTIPDPSQPQPLPQKSQPQSILHTLDKPISQLQSQIDRKVKQIYYQKYGVYEDEFQRTYKCVKSQSNGDQKMMSPIIQVSDPLRKTTGGLFFGVGASSFLSFKIDTLEYSWSVRRRYGDFQWLRNVILKLFPSYCVPPLPKKNAKKRSARDIEKRMHILSYFLNDLSNIPAIMHSRYVLGFLGLTSNPEFEELKREGNSKPPFEQITSISTETGDITIGITQDDKVYLSEIQKYVSGSQLIFKAMTASSKQLQACIIQQTNTLYKMGNLYADLFTLLKDCNDKLPPPLQQISLADTYVTLNNMLIEWGNTTRQQHSFIEKNFNTFIRYTRNESYSLNDQLQKIQQLEQEFFKNSIQLEKRKEKVFQMGDFSKWDVPQEKYPVLMQTGILKNKEKAMRVMLPKETYQLDKWRTQYAFYSSQFRSNSNRMLNKQADKFRENFKQFAITIKVNFQQLTEMWNEASANFSNPKKKQNLMQTPKEQEIEQMYDDG